MRIVSTYALVGAEPNDFFAIDKNSVHMIGPQRAAATFESEMLTRLSVFQVKRPVTICRHPDVFARTSGDRCDWAGSNIRSRRLYWISLVEEGTLIFPTSRARP